LALVCVGGLCVALLYSPALAVRHVEVLGNAHTPRAQVLQAAGLSGQSGSVEMIDAGSAREVRALEALPWVSVASFARHWPWTIVITVKERVPVAIVAPGATEAVVDETGRVLEVGAPPPGAGALPVVTGVTAAPPGQQSLPGPGETRAELDALLRAAAVVPRSLATRGITLSAHASVGLVAHVRGANAVVVLGGATSLALKLAVLGELAARVNLSAYSTVDLRVPTRPALTPSGNSSTGSP
jgi:cell division protein FtsQ